ncbi:MAG: OprO/OprP family phosphate-selective porin, partial [Synergistaceae bacterium]|nr:OprO/OprP family phosphate-selective porin [Synergistaceae bacterium]
VELKGIYYFSGWDDDPGVDDSGKAWKAILDVDQDLLKFTSLWLEYGQIDNNVREGVMGAIGHRDADFYRGSMPGWSGITPQDPEFFPGRDDGTTKVFIVNTQQKWNDKWSTYLRYAHWDFDAPAGALIGDKADEWTVGAKYQYTDALSFELSYDNVSWDDVAGAEDSDHLIRFRTFVAF